jgi:hypothetical protein
MKEAQNIDINPLHLTNPDKRLPPLYLKHPVLLDLQTFFLPLSFKFNIIKILLNQKL